MPPSVYKPLCIVYRGIFTFIISFSLFLLNKLRQSIIKKSTFYLKTKENDDRKDSRPMKLLHFVARINHNCLRYFLLSWEEKREKREKYGCVGVAKCFIEKVSLLFIIWFFFDENITDLYLNFNSYINLSYLAEIYFLNINVSPPLFRWTRCLHFTR